ncbi:MAG TPA: UDP-N-acetylmuramoyl-tripeptide--D-alanyl-D-alanine ligase [Kineosporiaceae bacterium]|nr:UDP-N-acetylmuramoyl-tripeptide--D-alanyl-D-alanine ligase [Kineosporiaceae bacterium]
MLTLDDITAAVPAAVIGDGPGQATSFSRAGIDTRDLVGGELFVAIRGAARDGHDFVGAAVSAGAAGLLVSRDVQAPAGVRVIRVPDTLEALQGIGAAVRARSGATVVAVTGSAGKTTTKTMIAQVLSEKYSVQANKASFNNHLGVPLNLTAIDPHSTHVVAEIGTNHPGEIGHLASLVRPDIAVITNVGWAHIGNFADHDALAAEKTDLLRAVGPGGTLVVNGDDPQLARIVATLPGLADLTVIRYGFDDRNDIRAVDVTVTEAGTRGTLRVASTGQEVPFHLAVSGRHFAYAAMAATAVAVRCGIGPEVVAASLAVSAPPAGRGTLRRQDDGLLVLDDTYNGSPDAMLSSLDLLGSLPGRMRIAVLGEMGELGQSSTSLHRRVGAVAARHATHLITVGNTAALQDEALAGGLPAANAHTVDSALEALHLVHRILGDRDPSVGLSDVVVLAKGSRFRHMERVCLGLAGTAVTCPKDLCTLYINCATCDQLA